MTTDEDDDDDDDDHSSTHQETETSEPGNPNPTSGHLRRTRRARLPKVGLPRPKLVRSSHRPRGTARVPTPRAVRIVPVRMRARASVCAQRAHKRAPPTLHDFRHARACAMGARALAHAPVRNLPAPHTRRFRGSTETSGNQQHCRSTLRPSLEHAPRSLKSKSGVHRIYHDRLL